MPNGPAPPPPLHSAQLLHLRVCPQDLQGVLAPGAVCGASLSGDDAASSRVHPQALWKALTVADGDKPDMEPGTLVPPGATLPALTRAVQFMGDKWDRQLRVIYSRGWQVSSLQHRPLCNEVCIEHGLCKECSPCFCWSSIAGVVDSLWGEGGWHFADGGSGAGECPDRLMGVPLRAVFGRLTL